MIESRLGVDQNYRPPFGPLDYREYTIVQTPNGPIILINPRFERMRPAQSGAPDSLKDRGSTQTPIIVDAILKVSVAPAYALCHRFLKLLHVPLQPRQAILRSEVLVAMRRRQPRNSLVSRLVLVFKRQGLRSLPRQAALVI